ncbi:MAG: 4-hydroxy-tetrahydrodipicolinate reductase [Clostridia bacterium]|nr:4-hydroxy-tetrahydrodipicolinate reductase [Clostridia bacterium]
MQVIVHGAAGHMGTQVISALERKGHAIAALVDKSYETAMPGVSYPCYPSMQTCDQKADCVIDFSHHSATSRLLQWTVGHGVPVMIATTGHTEEEREEIVSASCSVPVFLAANMSLGVAVLTSLVRKAVRLFPDADIEIVETHHNRKLDAPSGTALALAEAIRKERTEVVLVCGRSGHQKRDKNEIGIHSIRMGNIVGIHEIHITTANEMLTLKHEAFSREVFADGAVLAAEFLCGKNKGLYTMEDFVQIGEPSKQGERK